MVAADRPVVHPPAVARAPVVIPGGQVSWGKGGAGRDIAVLPTFAGACCIAPDSSAAAGVSAIVVVARVGVLGS